MHLGQFILKEDENQSEIQLLLHICKANLVEKWTEKNEYIDKIRLSDTEKQIIIDGSYCTSNNMEIKARCNDVMRNGSRAYSEMSVTASDSYLSLYQQDHDCITIVRSLIVRGSSNIDTKFMDMLLSAIENSVLFSNSLDRIITYLNKTKISLSWKDRLIAYVDNRMKEESQKDSYHQYRGYINSMYLLEQLSIEERDRNIALAYEQEADNKIANRKPDTFYMGLEQLYKDGLKRISPHRKKYSDIYNRLCDKLRRQQQHFSDMMGKLPPFKISISEDVQKMVNQFIDSIEIKDFVDVVIMFMRIFVINEQTQKILISQSEKEEYSILDWFCYSQQDIH